MAPRTQVNNTQCLMFLVEWKPLSFLFLLSHRDTSDKACCLLSCLISSVAFLVSVLYSSWPTVTTFTPFLTHVFIHQKTQDKWNSSESSRRFPEVRKRMSRWKTEGRSRSGKAWARRRNEGWENREERCWSARRGQWCPVYFAVYQDLTPDCYPSLVKFDFKLKWCQSTRRPPEPLPLWV